MPTTTVRLNGEHCACSPGELCPVSNRRVGSEYRCHRDQIEAVGFGVEEQASSEYPILVDLPSFPDADLKAARQQSLDDSVKVLPFSQYYIVYERVKLTLDSGHLLGPYSTQDIAQREAERYAKRFSTALNIRVTDAFNRPLTATWLNPYCKKDAEERACAERVGKYTWDDPGLVDLLAEAVHVVVCHALLDVFDQAIRQPNGGIELGSGLVNQLDSHRHCAYDEQLFDQRTTDRQAAKEIIQKIKDYYNKE